MKKPLLLFLACLATFVAKSQTGSLEATVIARRGNIVELRPTVTDGENFKSGTQADMSKHFEEKFGTMTMQGWLGVATVEFIPTTRQNIEVKILQEKSEITVNGEKVDHFKPGKRMKLEWPAKPEEPDPEK